MKRCFCIVLALIMSMSLMASYTIGAADVREEFIRTDKSTYEVGEMFEIQFEFDGTDSTRWICFYKGTVTAANMVYAVKSNPLRASNVFAPVVATGVNGIDADALTQPGTYTMKVMYLAEGGDGTVAADFSEGAKSALTHTFSIQAGGSTVPSIAVADREIGKGGSLNVQFEGVVNTLNDHSLNVELWDSKGNVIKSRQLWNGIYYAGKSGEVSISLADVEPGEYTVRLVCSNSEYVLGTDAVDIIVTQESESTSNEIFPDNLFSSADVCEKYFANADNPGNTYEFVDGEYVMHVPLHPGNDYMYSWESIPYSKFTVTFEFLLHIVPGSQYSDEMDFLFGMPAAGIPFHQVTLAHHAGTFELRHYKHTGATFEHYEFDNMFIDIYEEEQWFEFTAEITPDEVSIYLNGDWCATLEDTANCIDAYGHIGLRGGSTGGWKVKNLKVAPGTLSEQESGDVTDETPTTTPTGDSTETPPVAQTQTPAPQSTSEIESTPKANNNGGSAWIWIVICITVVVLGGGIVAFVFLRKKK